MNKINIANYHDTQLGYYCGRANKAHGLQASALHNPFPLDKKNDTPEEREKLLVRYEKHLREKIAAKDTDVMWELEFLVRQHLRRDITLLCWCEPKICHIRIIAQIVREMAAPFYETLPEPEPDPLHTPLAAAEQEDLFL